jgi:hypothetical protein
MAWLFGTSPTITSMASKPLKMTPVVRQLLGAISNIAASYSGFFAE